MSADVRSVCRLEKPRCGMCGKDHYEGDFTLFGKREMRNVVAVEESIKSNPWSDRVG